jgi:hypothetical protein
MPDGKPVAASYVGTIRPGNGTRPTTFRINGFAAAANYGCAVQSNSRSAW